MGNVCLCCYVKWGEKEVNSVSIEAAAPSLKPLDCISSTPSLFSSPITHPAYTTPSPDLHPQQPDPQPLPAPSLAVPRFIPPRTPELTPIPSRLSGKISRGSNNSIKSFVSSLSDSDVYRGSAILDSLSYALGGDKSSSDSSSSNNM